VIRSRVVPPLVSIAAAVLLGGAPPARAAGDPAATAPREPSWRYVVSLTRIEPPLFRVSATVRVDGDRLEMDTTRPGDLPEILERGWPALVTGLRVTDASGRPVEATFAGASAWTLPHRLTGTLRLDYEVDYTLLAKHGWPAPREAAYVEPGTIALIGRSLFITAAPGAGTAAFELPAGWIAAGPFPSPGGAVSRFDIASTEDLTANLIVLTRDKPVTTRAGGFSLAVAPAAARRLYSDILRGR
jgi:hypothetical protein